MKRTIQYTAHDGATFPTRAACVTHEVSLVRRVRIKEYLIQHLKLADGESPPEGLDRIIEAMISNPSGFYEACSERATKRTLPKNTAPLRKKRYRGVAKVALQEATA